MNQTPQPNPQSRMLYAAEAPPVLENPAQIENSIHTSSVWAEARLVAVCADIAGCLETPQEQRDEDLGRSIDRADAAVRAALPSGIFFEQEKDH